jgi:hypothetical protein
MTSGCLRGESEDVEAEENCTWRVSELFVFTGEDWDWLGV